MASCAVHLTVAGYHDDVGMATRTAVVWEFSGQVVCVMTLLRYWNLVLQARTGYCARVNTNTTQVVPLAKEDSCQSQYYLSFWGFKYVCILTIGQTGVVRRRSSLSHIY